MPHTVAVPDGKFDLHLWTPEAGSGPGIVLVQEIWGVSDYIEDVAEELAAKGYVVGAPDMFWRLQPNWRAEHDAEGLASSVDMMGRFDFAKGVDDLAAALDTFRGLDAVTGPVAALGFCFGGTMAFLLGARGGVDAVVSYYGSGVPDQADLLAGVKCPVQFEFGGNDPYLARDKVAVVERAAEGRPNVELTVEESAGHAFHNHRAPMFHTPEPAARAWARTEDFLARHLPV